MLGQKQTVSRFIVPINENAATPSSKLLPEVASRLSSELNCHQVLETLAIFEGHR